MAGVQALVGEMSAQKKKKKELVKQLLQVPALALPDVAKSLDLYIHEKRGVATGVLAQTLGLPYSSGCMALLPTGSSSYYHPAKGG